MATYRFEYSDDDDGVEIGCDNLEDVRKAVKEALADLARDSIPKDGDRQCLEIVARNDDGEIVYRARLLLIGKWNGRSRLSRGMAGL